MSDSNPPSRSSEAPRWRPLGAIDRRVLGVLIEKAKTTPDVYPLSVNALRSGVNQKNNRSPLMDLEIEDVEESLARLRAVGAVTEVQGSSRVPRFRHQAYEWLGVDKVELAIMAELLLRGAQTEGELRGRAARMEPIADLNALRPLLDSLKAKGLVVALTPEGRGHVVTHALYEPRELEKLRAEANLLPRATESDSDTMSAAGQVAESSRRSGPAVVDPRLEQMRSELSALQEETGELRSLVSQLRRELDELQDQLR